VPWIAVPGNHDVPLYDVLRRFLSPLSRYRRYIDDTLCPYHELPGAASCSLQEPASLGVHQLLVQARGFGFGHRAAEAGERI